MFIRRTVKGNVCYYDLAESYRDESGTPRHRILVALGRNPTIEEAINETEYFLTFFKPTSSSKRNRAKRLTRKLEILRSVVRNGTSAPHLNSIYTGVDQPTGDGFKQTASG